MNRWKQLVRMRFDRSLFNLNIGIPTDSVPIATRALPNVTSSVLDRPETSEHFRSAMQPHENCTFVSENRFVYHENDYVYHIRQYQLRRKFHILYEKNYQILSENS